MYDFDIQKGVVLTSGMTYINIALNIGLDEKPYSFPIGVQFCLLGCELLQSLGHLTTWWKQIPLSPLISVKLNPGKCPGTIYSTPESFAFLKLIGLKDFFVCLFAATLEMVCYKDLDLFFWVFYCKLENLGTKE